jgi:hypothetical protein
MFSLTISKYHSVTYSSGTRAITLLMARQVSMERSSRAVTVGNCERRFPECLVFQEAGPGRWRIPGHQRSIFRLLDQLGCDYGVKPYEIPQQFN